MATEQKIRYSDCDPQGIVFNGNYARYWDDAATDWLEEAGFGGLQLGGIGVDVVTARLEIDFENSATMGDTLITTPSAEQFGITSMMIRVITRRKSDDELVAKGRLIFVFVDPDSFRPVSVPEAVKSGLK